MSVEQNKALVRRFWDSFNQGDVDAIVEMTAPNFVLHDPSVPAPVQGPQALAQLVRTYLAASPDLHFTIDDMIAEGDKVVVRWTARGRDTGRLFGNPPTGKQTTAMGLNITRVEDGKVAAAWQVWDVLGLMRQVGAIPPMGQGGSNP